MKTVPLTLLLCLLCACGAEEIVYQDPDTSKSDVSDEEGDNGDTQDNSNDRDGSNTQDCPINNPASCPFPGITVDPDTGCVCAPLSDNDPTDPSTSPFRFVLIQDDAPSAPGETPGADIDAIGLIKSNGLEVFATTVSDQSDVSCDNNSACDITALLGPPDVIDDSGCFGGGDVDTTLFVSLNQGFVIASFSGDGNGDQVIENGDAIYVYEIGATECGRFDDEPYTVSVGVSDNNTGTFIELGSTGSGDNIIEIQGL